MKGSIWVVIPAAGKGARFGGDIPKQYHVLHDITVLQQTLNRFLSRSDVKGIVLALDEHNFHEFSCPEFERIKLVIGGQDRASSVYNAIKSLEGLVAENDLIAVHDVARPCVRQSSLNELFECASRHEIGAILACLSTDTIKFVNNDVIEKTLDRNHIWAAQTPQVFRYGLLKQALEFSQNTGSAITDESSAIELLGFHPVVVQGRNDNIKITHADDLALAAYYLDKIQKEND